MKYKLLFLTLSLPVLSDLSDRRSKAMSLIPVPVDSFTPLLHLKTVFGALISSSNDNKNNHRNSTNRNPDKNDLFALAHVVVNTSRPSVHLENFLEITKISCPNTDEIDLVFDKAENAMKAFKIWSKIPEMGILIGHENDCNQGSAASFILHNMALVSNRMIMDVERVDRYDIVQDWTISITQYATIDDDDKKKENHLSKRDLGRNFTIPLNFNGDAIMKSLGNPFFWFLGSQYIICVHCYTRGKAQLELEFRGHLRKLQSYKMRISGDFEADFSLKFSALPRDETYLWWNYITIIDLTPFYLPGLFSIGPSFRIMGAIVTYADTEVSGILGFNLKMPFDHQVSSSDFENKELSTSEYKNTHQTTFTYRPFNVTVFDPKPTYIGGHVMVAPEIGVGFTFHKQPLFDMAVRIQNQLGFINRYGNLTKCAGEKPSVEIFRRHKFQHTISPAPLVSFIYNDWDSEIIPITCIDCNSCAADPHFFQSQRLVGRQNSQRDDEFANITARFNKLMDTK